MRVFSVALPVIGLALTAMLLTTPTWAKGPKAKPRPVSPRGALLADEKRQVEVFRRVSPSVVHINTAARTRLNPNSSVPQGSGTGFIWDNVGHIVTNYHVVANSNVVRVTLSDQSVWKAKIIGVFPDRDLAVLDIDAPRGKMPPIPLGTSRGLQVGQRVYAIGNPFGLDQTMTTGVISALDREIPGSKGRVIRGVIQSDAAINPGNSGGPLLDSAGLLIGVNTAIYSLSGSSAGIGFSIPADEVNRIVPRLINDGRFIRPVLGIEGAPARFLESIKEPPGVPVFGVQRGGPAHRAGFRPFERLQDGRIVVGDVIVGIGLYEVRSLDDLYAALEEFLPEDRVSVHVRRNGTVIKIPLRLGR